MVENPEYVGLLADVRSAPADDTPRLILADWLEDHGHHARAQFIRVQWEIARVEAQSAQYPWVAGRMLQPLRDREKELLGGEPGWLGFCYPLPELLGWTTPWHECLTFRRGLVAQVRCPLTDWNRYGKKTCAWHPIEYVEPTDRLPTQARTETELLPEFRWFRLNMRTTSYYQSYLPDDIFDALEGGTLNEGNWCRYYPTLESAQAALSDVLLRQAGAAHLVHKGVH